MLTFRQFNEAAFAYPADYSLESKYQHFNHLLFNGQLPNIPISWVPSIHGGKVSGITLARGKNFGYNIEPGTIRVQIAALYKSSEDRLDGILVHEMIHVYFFAIKDDGRESHGPNFRKKVEELQHKVPFTIPLTDNTMGMDLSDSVRAVDMGVILMKDPRGIWVSFIGKTDWQRNGQRLMVHCLKKSKPDTTYTFHYGRTNLHRKYPEALAKGDKYGVTKFSFSKLEPQNVETLETLPLVHPAVSDSMAAYQIQL